MSVLSFEAVESLRRTRVAIEIARVAEFRSRFSPQTIASHLDRPHRET
ncbi:MAG: hypothetical protein SWY16_13870 [Cyanobacteriota bacterium]|nr:hypothetical protein [Cyanobacteriota bacterium]